MNLSLRGRRVLPFLQTAGVTYAGTALSVVSSPLLAHAVGADGRGVLAGAFVLLQVLSWVSFLGLPRGLALQGIKRQHVSIAGTVVVFGLGFASAAAAIGLADVISNGDARIAMGIRISSVVLVLSGLQQLGAELVLFEGRIGAFNLIRSAVLILPSVAYIVLFLFGKLTLENAYITTLLGQIISVLIGCYFALGLLKSARRVAIPWNFSLKYWLTSALDSVGGRLDQLSLSALTSSSVLGVYAVALSCASASGGLTQALTTLAYSSFNRASEQEHGALMRRRSLLGLAASVVSGTVICVIVAVLGRQIFGPDFAGMTPIVIVLVLAQLIADQWELRSVSDSARESLGSLVAASAIGIVMLGAAIVALNTFGVLTGLTMAFGMLLYSAARVSSRAILKRGRERVKH